MIAARSRVTGRRHQRGAGTQRQRRRTGRQPNRLAEELDLDAVALDVTVAQETDDATVLQGLQQHGAGVLVEWFDADADRLALCLEPGEECRRLEVLGHRGHAEAQGVEERTPPLPAADVGQRDDRAAAQLFRVVQVLQALADAKAREDVRRFYTRELRSLGPVLSVTLETAFDESFQRGRFNVAVTGQRVGDVRSQVRPGPGAATTDDASEASRQGDVQSLGQSLHDGTERLEQRDLRGVAHG